MTFKDLSIVFGFNSHITGRYFSFKSSCTLCIFTSQTQEGTLAIVFYTCLALLIYIFKLESRNITNVRIISTNHRQTIRQWNCLTGYRSHRSLQLSTSQSRVVMPFLVFWNLIWELLSNTICVVTMDSHFGISDHNLHYAVVGIRPGMKTYTKANLQPSTKRHRKLDKYEKSPK